MTGIKEKLEEFGLANKGTDLGAVLQWALLHIQSQDEALAETREELARETAERTAMQQALEEAKTATESALQAISKHLCPPIELARDMGPHINIMACHGDPDYLMASGKSIRHVDLRSAKPKTKKVRT